MLAQQFPKYKVQEHVECHSMYMTACTMYTMETSVLAVMNEYHKPQY